MQCTCTVIPIFWVSEGHINGEADLDLFSIGCSTCSGVVSTGGILQWCHNDINSESEFSDEEVLSDSILTGDCQLSLGYLVKIVRLSIALYFFFRKISLERLWFGFSWIIFWPEGRLMSSTLLMPEGSNLNHPDSWSLLTTTSMTGKWQP